MLAITTIIFVYYTSTVDVTLALATAKQSITEKLSLQELPYTINKLENIQCGAALKINATTIPTTLTTANFDQAPTNNISKVKTEIDSITSYSSANTTITINGGTPTCP